jgi:hypothetical protein
MLGRSSPPRRYVTHRRLLSAGALFGGAVAIFSNDFFWTVFQPDQTSVLSAGSVSR